MESPRNILEWMNKHQLIDLILEYSDNNYFPLELFLLNADYIYEKADLERFWGNIYSQALEYDENDVSQGADYLADAAGLFFNCIKRLEDTADQKSLCELVINDLYRASVDDGIGMGSDSEWLYDEVEEKIQDYLSTLE